MSFDPAERIGHHTVLDPCTDNRWTRMWMMTRLSTVLNRPYRISGSILCSLSIFLVWVWSFETLWLVPGLLVAFLVGAVYHRLGRNPVRSTVIGIGLFMSAGGFLYSWTQGYLARYPVRSTPIKPHLLDHSLSIDIRRASVMDDHTAKVFLDQITDLQARQPERLPEYGLAEMALWRRIIESRATTAPAWLPTADDRAHQDWTIEIRPALRSIGTEIAADCGQSIGPVYSPLLAIDCRHAERHFHAVRTWVDKLTGRTIDHWPLFDPAGFKTYADKLITHIQTPLIRSPLLIEASAIESFDDLRIVMELHMWRRLALIGLDPESKPPPDPYNLDQASFTVEGCSVRSASKVTINRCLHEDEF